jgi:hypothetical protein
LAVAEPTLLQQARHFLDAARSPRWGDRAYITELRVTMIADAFDRMLRHLEQREAATQSATAMCKECGLHRQHWAHDRTQDGNTDPEHPELKPHTFDPKSVDARLVELEAMSEAHGHNISTLFADLDAYLEHRMAKPAQVPDAPKCKVCGLPKHYYPVWVTYNDSRPNVPLHIYEPETPDAPIPKRGQTVQEYESMLAASEPALDLDELQRLCDAATEGPWSYDGAGRVTGCGPLMPEGDAQFIAAARDALPKLIARVQQLQSMVTAARDWADQFSEYEDPVAEATLNELRALLRAQRKED